MASNVKSQRFESLLPLEQKSLHTQVTTSIVGELILQLHTHQLHSFNSRGINLCNACVSLVSACLASMISQKGNYTSIMLGELNIQLHAHQLHINNCWGINCVIIPAPMVLQLQFYPCLKSTDLQTILVVISRSLFDFVRAIHYAAKGEGRRG